MKKPVSTLKILHLISSSGLFGAERVVLTLGKQQAEGIDFWIGAVNNRHNSHLEMITEAQASGLKTVVFDSKGQADFQTVLSIRKFLKENNIGLVHTHNYKSDILGFLATRFLPTRWVATNHTWHSTDHKMRFYEFIDSLVLRFADGVSMVSSEIQERMAKLGFAKDRLHVIHNGISLQDFEARAERSALRKQWGVKDHELLMTIVGRLAPEKGHQVLFKALSLLVPRFPFFKCVVVGDGPLREDLVKLVKDLDLGGRVIFAGIRRDMAAVYSACDMMVNASSIEGLPMTILEAMACGLPVVATKVGAVPQVIQHGQCGVLLRANEPALLAEALVELAHDPLMRCRLSKAAKLKVQSHFSDGVMFKKYGQFYQRSLSL